MAVDKVVIQYEADISKLQAQLGEVISKLEKVEAESKQAGKAGEHAFKQEAAAIHQTDKAVDNLTASTKAHGQAAQQAGKESKKAFDDAGAGAKNLGNIMGPLKGQIAAALTVGTVLALGKAVFDATSQFQKFSAVLTTALGSSSAAQKAMKMLQDWAAKTPFQLTEATESFIKLVNRGFKPTEAEMTKMGDIAASQGKNLDQLVEAMLDAQMGEGERLKELGIRMSVNGNKVSLSFKGITTEVNNNEKAIRDAILAFGDLQGVQGSMASISKTLGGQVSNLLDSFDKLAVTIGEKLGPFMGGLINAFGGLVSAVTGLFSANDNYIKQSTQVIESNLKTGKAANALLEEYDNLTKKGVVPTKEEKQRLNEITLQLKQTLGDTVVEIDKETGAYKLNASAAKEAVKQKFLLANQEALTLALRANALKDNIDQIKASNKAEADANKTRQAQLAAMGGASTRSRNAPNLTQAERDNIALQDAIVNTKNLLSTNNKNLKEYSNERNDILKELKKLGFDQADVDKLLAESANDSNVKLDDAQKERIDLYKKHVDAARDYGVQLSAAEEKALVEAIKKAQAAAEKAAKEAEKNKRPTTPMKKIDTRTDKLQVDAMKGLAKTIEDNNVQAAKDGNDKILEEQKKFEKAYSDYKQQQQDERNEKALKAEIEKEEFIKNARIDILKQSTQAAFQLGQYYLEKQSIERDKDLQRETEALDAKQAALAKQLETGAISKKEFEALSKKLDDERTAAEKQAAEDQAEIRRKQAIVDKAAALFDIGLNTALAVIKAIKFSPETFGAPWSVYAAVQGAIQAALVAAKPIPEFAEGTLSVKGGIPGKDSVHALLMPDEAVIPTKKANQHRDALAAIMDDRFDDWLLLNRVLPAMRKAEREKGSSAERMYASMNMQKAFSDRNIVAGQGRQEKLLQKLVRNTSDKSGKGNSFRKRIN
jgi:hypothetical protein